MMGESENGEWTKQSNFLRAELKLWEKEFATANNGQKASRNDIKNHPDIAAKYKEYNKVRDLLSGKVIPTKEETKHHTPRKRKHEGEHLQASKRQQIIQTPSKGIIKPWDVDPYDSPSAIRNLFTPLKKTTLGPTPQKDGQVLGLFDLLQEDLSPLKTETIKTAGTKIPVQGTPRKLNPEEAFRHSRTPASVGKRFMLDAFATPLKTRSPNGRGDITPSSISKLQFATPSFLKRDSRRTQLPTLNEKDQGTSLSPEMVRVPRKPLMRGLSSMLAGLRKMEEEAADDDLEALHEMENEMASLASKPASKQQPPGVPKDPILVQDSQPRLPLSGFDNEAMYDTEPEPPNDRDSQPVKVYKKKGQKRTTRRVTMKPTRSAPQSQPAIPTTAMSDDELAVDPNIEEVPETQIDGDYATAGFANARNFDSDSQSEYTASEGGTRYKRPNQSKKRKVMGKDGKIRSVAKKVNAMAHQNFKRLKLRNSGAKGGPAHNSRFRRRK